MARSPHRSPRHAIARGNSKTAAWAVSIGLVFAALLTPSEAAAYEDQWTLDLDLQYAIALDEGDSIPTHAPGLGVGFSLGLTDAWSVRGRLSYAWHPGDLDVHAFSALAEVYYLLDIVQVVPFFGVGLGGFGTVADGDFGADLSVHAVVGLDWLISRKWVLGVDIRPHLLPFSLESGLDPFYLTMSVRLSVVFDRI